MKRAAENPCTPTVNWGEDTKRFCTSIASEPEQKLPWETINTIASFLNSKEQMNIFMTSKYLYKQCLLQLSKQLQNPDSEYHRFNWHSLENIVTYFGEHTRSFTHLSLHQFVKLKVADIKYIIEHFPKLKYLALRVCRAASLTHLQLEHLIHINLFNNSFPKILEHCKNLPDIQSLSLSRCDKLTMADLENNLSSFTKLHTFDISFCNLKNLNFLTPSIHTLNISGCEQLMEKLSEGTNMAKNPCNIQPHITTLHLNCILSANLVHIFYYFPNLSKLHIDPTLRLIIQESPNDLLPPFFKNGTLVEKNRFEFSGSFKGFSLTHERGTYKSSVYTGPIENGIPHGKGRRVFAKKGEIYEGDFVEGRREGKGILFLKGFTYEGEFLNNKLHGRGILKNLQNNSTYEGDFIKGIKEGHGILNLNDNIYEGQFLNNRFHGRGKMQYKCGMISKGYFVNGQREGPCTTTFKNGTIFSGLYEKNIPKGMGKWVYPDGEVLEGDCFYKGENEGAICTGVYRKNGQDIIGTFRTLHSSKPELVDDVAQPK